MEIQAIVNDAMPRAIGPYSHAVRAGDLLFVAGQTGIDPEAAGVPGGGFDAEARMAFLNVGRVLRAAGLDFDSSGQDHRLPSIS